MPTFRLLHITDLHISIPPEENGYGQRTGWKTREYVYASGANPYALEAIAEFVFEHRGGTNLILISGDVADDGEQRNLDAALRFIAAPPTHGWYVTQKGAIEGRLDAGRGAGPLFFIIPGNHDRFEGVRRLPAGEAFNETFKAHWDRGLGGVKSVSLPPTERPVLSLIAADFCLRNASGPLGRPNMHYLGQGRAYQEVIDPLVDETARIRRENPDVGIVWISHFPPLLEIEQSLKLVDAERLIDAASENGVRHIIAGHLHRNQINTYSDVEIICTGTAASTSAGERHGFWIQRADIEVSASGEVTIELSKFRYNQMRRKFIEQR